MATRDLSTGEVAEILGVHPSTVTRIPPDQLAFDVTPGGHRRYRQVDVDAYIAAKRRRLQAGHASR